MVGLLLKAGVVRRRDDGSLRWPVHVAPWWIWRVRFHCLIAGEWVNAPVAAFGVFRNLPGVRRDVGTWLPRRWGVQILGLEIGQRG